MAVYQEDRRKRTTTAKHEQWTGHVQYSLGNVTAAVCTLVWHVL